MNFFDPQEVPACVEQHSCGGHEDLMFPSLNQKSVLCWITSWRSQRISQLLSQWFQIQNTGPEGRGALSQHMPILSRPQPWRRTFDDKGNHKTGSQQLVQQNGPFKVMDKRRKRVMVPNCLLKLPWAESRCHQHEWHQSFRIGRERWGDENKLLRTPNASMVR